MKFKIRKIRKEKGITQAALAQAAGLSQPFLSLLERKADRAPSMETLVAIAAALGVRTSDLIDDAAPVPVVGRVGAGARVPLVAVSENGEGLYQVACPPGLPLDARMVAVEIEGDSMLPAYKAGDILFYTREFMGVPGEAVGSVCVCEDEDGDAWVKYVKHGSAPGHFHLISLNPLADNMFDVRLKWAAPVRLHWPKDLVEKV